MPVGIVQVLNNTSHTLRYHNLESRWRFDLPPTPSDQPEGPMRSKYIVSSAFHDDTVPFHNSNHISIWFDDTTDSRHTIEISDDNWRFRVAGIIAGQGTKIDALPYGSSLTNGGQYMLKVDEYEARRGAPKQCYLRFLKYEDWCKLEGPGPGRLTLDRVTGAREVAMTESMDVF